MNKTEREIYLVLASEVDYTLCGFCKYSECVAGESVCDGGEPYCVHPLGERFEHSFSSYGIEPGMDCWGFRPSHSIDFCADIVGIVLAKGWNGGAVWWKNKKGNWKVAPMQI